MLRGGRQQSKGKRQEARCSCQGHADKHVAQRPQNEHCGMLLTDVSAFCDSFSSESLGRLGMASMSFSATCSGVGD